MQPTHPSLHLSWFVMVDGSTIAGFATRALAIEYISAGAGIPEHQELTLTHVSPGPF